MKNSPIPVERRTFLKTGLSGGVILSVFGFLKSSTPSSSTSGKQSDSLSRLRRIAVKYGGEFGNAKPEGNDQKRPHAAH